MIVTPKVRGFICTTAHAEGCKANVKSQIKYIKNNKKTSVAKNVLVIGASTGYGLASRIAVAYSNNAKTIGVIFDKSANGKRPATAGYYNTAAFEEFANADGIYAKSINGDAFSKEIKDETIALIKKDLGKVDMVIYSLASPRRTLANGETVSSVLKTTKTAYTNKTIDLKTNLISDITIDSATEQEIEDTVKVMGGEDWFEWIKALKSANAIEDDALTVAYSYIGPEVTHPMYLDGSIGMAKRDLYKTANEMKEKLNINAYIAVNKALVTQSSAAIPIVPLYISILYKVMKNIGNHEGCIEQMYRLFNEKLTNSKIPVDSENRIRLDDYEMQENVQTEVTNFWSKINDENVNEMADIEGYWDDFFNMFGFNVSGVDYEKEIDIDVKIPSLND